MRPHRNYPRQPVGWGTFTEAPPPVIAPYVEARPADWLLLAILRPAWAYRVELALISSAIGFGLFRTPLLRLVRVDGRRRAGYQAVALRPG